MVSVDIGFSILFTQSFGKVVDQLIFSIFYAKKISLLLAGILLLSACKEESQRNVVLKKTLSKAEQAKQETYKNDLYISALTVEKNNDLLFIAQRLKKLGNGTLDHMLIVHLLTK